MNIQSHDNYDLSLASDGASAFNAWCAHDEQEETYYNPDDIVDTDFNDEEF